MDQNICNLDHGCIYVNFKQNLTLSKKKVTSTTA